MAREFPPQIQALIQARSTAAEIEVKAEVERRCGWAWEQLDLPTNKRKRPEGCVVINGKRSVLVEVKRAETGGGSADGTVMLSDLDPDLHGAGVKQFPAIPPNVACQLDHARAKHIELTEDRKEFRGLPYVVVYCSNDFVSLDRVDRRMPNRREISGLVYIERGRRLREALESLPEGDLNRRLDEGDLSGMPDASELEWRLVPNPYAKTPVPVEFRAECIVGWPGDVEWPESLSSEDEERGRALLTVLLPNERAVLEATYWVYGRADASKQAFAPARQWLEHLVDRGLAKTTSASKFELTTDGLRLGLVLDLDGSSGKPSDA